ncbi:unnamed protein product [Musa hybrid cultivar]
MRRHQRLDEPEPVEPRRELVFRDLSRSRSGAALPRRSRSRRVVPLSRRSWRRGNRGRRRREQRKRRPRGTRRRTRPSSSPNGLRTVSFVHCRRTVNLCNPAFVVFLLPTTCPLISLTQTKPN